MPAIITRMQAVMARRWLDPQKSADLGKLDAAAIDRVREEAFPDARDVDELHHALLAFEFRQLLWSRTLCSDCYFPGWFLRYLSRMH